MEAPGIYMMIAFVAGFLVAQIWKLIAGLVNGYRTHEIKNFKTAIGYFTRSGGMPSGHAASMTALTAYTGLLYGFGQVGFGLLACLTAIVVYDATHVRYAVGEQGKALNKLLKRAGEQELPVTEGHTMGQVVVGMLLGALVAAAVYVWLTPNFLKWYV